MSHILVMSDEKAVSRTLARPGNVVVPAEACRLLDGFVVDTFSEYRNRSVLRARLNRQTQTPSTLGLANTFAGRYYLAVAMQDSTAGDEPLGIWMGRRKLADVTASTDDDRVRLFVCREPLQLKGGESFRVTTAANGRPYRIESIALLKRLPKHGAACSKTAPMPLPALKRRRGVSAKTLPLTIQGRAGARAEDFPLTTGVPLPVGHLYDATRVELLDAARQRIPLQVRASRPWPDDSVRWLLLDFQHRVCSTDQRLFLHYGRDVPSTPAERGLARRVETGVTIDTGAATLEISDRDVCLPGRVGLAGVPGPLTPLRHAGSVELVTADGTRYVSRGQASSVEIEENGPLRTVVKVELTHVDSGGNTMFRSTARLHAYAGKSWFRTSYTFTNDNTAEPFTHLRSLALKTPLVAPPETATRVVQGLDNHYTSTATDEADATGKRFGGLLLSRAGDCVYAVAVRDFWQNYPKALGIGPDGLEVGICPDVSTRDYKVGGYEEDRLYYYLADGAYKLKCGMARTHELFYGFAPATGAATLRREAKAFLSTPLVRAESRTYVASGAVGDLALKGTPDADYERWLEDARRGFLADRTKRRAYGMMNYGDWFGERRYNWGNMEYDTPWVFLNEYLRGGPARWFDWGREAACHLVDVDTCHASPNPDAVAGQYAHCMGHVGGYYPSGYREASTAAGGMTPSHTWVEGLFLYAAMSGDARAFENSKATCDRLAASVDPLRYDFGNCRDSGWVLIHLCAAHRATLGQHYLDAARVVVERVLERQRESGGWERMMVPGHCYCDPPRHMGNAAFMVGVLLAGLKRYHQITRDRRVRTCIVRAAQYVVDVHWIPERQVFRYTNCPHVWASVSMNPQMLEGLGYAWRLSKSEKIAEALIAAVDRCYSPELSDPESDARIHLSVPGYPDRVFDIVDEGLGKSVSLWMRQAPFALVDYQRAKAQLGSAWTGPGAH